MNESHSFFCIVMVATVLACILQMFHFQNYSQLQCNYTNTLPRARLQLQLRNCNCNWSQITIIMVIDPSPGCGC